MSAFRLKSVKFQETPRKILLQNENGPCPLIAAANALLLRGIVALPPSCVQNGVASINDVVNTLAEHALKRLGDHASTQPTPTPAAESGAATAEGRSTSSEHFREHHVNELLLLFPSLQYGMDVNPKLTAGPTGVEYTKNLTAFDLMGVDLVHGWLVDPQDVETMAVVANKSYNELIELVVRGNDAAADAQRIGALISEKEGHLAAARQTGHTPPPAPPSPPTFHTQQQQHAPGDPLGQLANDINTQLTIPQNHQPQSDAQQQQQQQQQQPNEPSPTQSSANGQNDTQPHNVGDADDISKLELEISHLRKKLDEQSVIATNGSVLNAFLTNTGHQLTYHGLLELHRHVAEQSLCVFFRNNHFATITKHDGVLYLLVTDLGYANVSEIMWEKLDAIDGDTEYADDSFVKPKPRATLQPASGPALSPEQLLAQRSQADADFQLALQISRNGGNSLSPHQIAEEDARVIEAAKEASLQEYNKTAVEQQQQQQQLDSNPNNVPTATETPPPPTTTTTTTTTTAAVAAETAVLASDHQTAIMSSNNRPISSGQQEETDRAMALALQASLDGDQASMELAHRMQTEESRLAATANRNTRRPASRRNNSRNDDKSCIIS